MDSAVHQYIPVKKLIGLIISSNYLSVIVIVFMCPRSYLSKATPWQYYRMLRTFLSVCGVEQGIRLEEKKPLINYFSIFSIPHFFLFFLLAGSPVDLNQGLCSFISIFHILPTSPGPESLSLFDYMCGSNYTLWLKHPFPITCSFCGW